MAWHNAAKLNVRLEYPGRWGISNPVQGSIAPGTIDIRKGYEFSFEFFPEQDFSLVSVRAYKTSTLNALGDWRNIETAVGLLNSQAAINGRLDGIPALNPMVERISPLETPPSGGRFTFKINTEDDVTFVPVCEPRPRILRSNPPLISSLSPFPYNQKVSLVFNMPIDPATLQDNIRVEATLRSNSQPAGKEGNITEFFNISYLENDFIVELTAKNDQITLESLKMLSINIIIGPDIKNLAGNTMAGTQVVSYMTNASEAQIVYEANNITATRGLKTGETYTYPEAKFGDSNTQWNNPLIDRRFNDTDRNRARINFTVNNPLEITELPNRFTIVEHVISNLAGFPFTHSVTPKTYELSQTPGDDKAIQETDYSYTLDYELRSTHSGIINLIVLPWYESSVSADTIIAQDPSVASISGRFVTVVMDKTPPGIWHTDLNAVITGGYLSSGVYTFSENAEMTITLNGLGSLSDNYGSGGISYTNAWNRPWTMDEHEYLRWRVLVYIGNPEDEVLRHDSVWMSMSENSYTKNVNNTGMNLSDDANARYTVTVQFIDRMGNTSDITQEAALRRTIRRTTDVAPVPVTGLSAACTETGENRLTQITVKWTLPDGMDRAELSITGFEPIEKPRPLVQETLLPVPGNIPQEHTFTVPATIISGVRDGQPVSNIIRYDINVVGYNAAGSASAEELTIWNIPGMDITQTNTVHISTAAELQAINDNGLGSANANRNYILVNDIEITGEWTPIGTNTDSTTFQGKFYGNGHSVTINTFTTTNRENLGLFNRVNNTLIRELTVVYDTRIPINENTERFGGITATASGTTIILNTIVSGNISSGEISSTRIDKSIGGIVGLLSFTSAIYNCLSALDMDITNTGNIFFGGCVGNTSTGGSVGANNHPTHTGLEGITVRANLVLHQRAGAINAGGVVGRARAVVENKSLEYSGSLTAIKTETGSSIIGGIVGDSQGLSSTDRIVYSNLRVSGLITIPSSYTSDSVIRLGGLFGLCRQTIIDDGIVTADLRCDKAGTGDLYFGGLLGEADQFSEVRNCRYEKGYINSEGIGDVYIGGGFGNVLNNSLIINCSSNASFINVLRSNSTILVGGLIGGLTSANIDRCFALTEIKAEGNAVLRAGGLIGSWATNINNNITYTVSECFATGNISTFNNSTNSMIVGGLVGYIARTGGNGGLSIYNSYSTGNIYIDRRGGSGGTYAGGSIGYVDVSTQIFNIRNNFATGNVNAKSASTSDLFVGGLVGRINVSSGTSSTLQNNAALGSSVTAMGSSASAARTGRIFGASNINNNFNYARDDMRIEISNDYDNFSFPFWDGISTPAPTTYYRYPAAIGLSTQHGENISVSNFRNQSFWQNGLYHLNGNITFFDEEGDSITSAVVNTPISVRYSGTENVILQWYRNGSIILGATGALYKPLTAGSYTVTASNNNYSTLTSAAFTVINDKDDPVLAGNLSISPRINFIGAVLTAAYSGPESVTYQWYRDGNLISGATSSAYTTAAAGRYTVTASFPDYPSISSESVTITGRGLGFNLSYWSFNFIGRDGHPRLRWE